MAEHVHGINDQHLYPVKKLRVATLYHPGFSQGADRRAIERYKKQLRRRTAEPVFVCGHFLADGTHRVIAAHELGQEFILAHVCNE